jgi:monoamine oxidase
MAFSRRDMLLRIGAVGGAGATFAAMQSLGLAAVTPASAVHFALPPGSGSGRRVAVLGAGIAGLVAAYELRRAGYAVTVIEARDRIGGRVLTLRGGDRLEQIDRPVQHARFSQGEYFNAGAARIPSTHHLILDYARRFGVPLEVFVNSNDSAGWDFSGRVVPQRQMVNDLNGRIAELLGKAIDQRALDAAMPKDELAAFRGFLHSFGALDSDGSFRATLSSGYTVAPGGYDRPPRAVDALTLKQLLPSQAVALPYLFNHITDMQATMLQPIGGMDAITQALFREVRPSVRLNSPISAIRRAGDGIRIEHRGAATTADYCVCTLPGHLLARIPNDFSAAKQAALKDIPYLNSVKVAFEAPRFWERDDHIYGGLAWTDRLNENVIYPSHGFHSERGVLVGAYCAGWTHTDTPDSFAARPIAEQIRISADSIEALHPGKSRLLGKALAIDWGQVPYSEGVGAVGEEWSENRRGTRYAELLKPEGPIAFAGEHLSYAGLWQEGSALSAHEALKLIHAMVADRAGKPA